MNQPHSRQTFPTIPGNEIPASVPFRLVLALTGNLALWMTNLQVYSTGMTFSINASRRNGDKFLGMYGFGKPEAGHTPPMLFGIEDAAGTTSTNLPKARSGLRPSGGGGGNPNNAKMGYALTPLPASGLMSIYVAWPHFGIEETRFVVDTTAIHDATTEVITMWPLEDAAPAAFDIDDMTTPQIEIPSSGWFASAVDKQTTPPRDPSTSLRISFDDFE